MATFHIQGRLVVESAGPTWHLSGLVKGDKTVPNRLVLIRTADRLSPNIKAAFGQFLSAVQITDRAGRSGKLINVRINGPSPFPRGNSGSRHSGAPKSYQTEQLLFSYQKIQWLVSGNTSSSDEW